LQQQHQQLLLLRAWLVGAVVSWQLSIRLTTMTQLMTQLVYVIVTSLAAAGADIGHVMVLEDELPSTIPASRPTVPGKSSSSHSLFGAFSRISRRQKWREHLLRWHFFSDPALCINSNLYDSKPRTTQRQGTTS